MITKNVRAAVAVLALAMSPLALPAAPAASAQPAVAAGPCKAAYKQLTIMVTTEKRNVAEGDRLWDSHAGYIRASHRGLLVTYSLAKGPELSDPLDPASAPTGRVTYALTECYRTSADIQRHWRKTAAEWHDFNALVDWMKRPGTQVVTLHDGRVRNSLW
ncbi:hypothetical protein [Streptomyces adelaidensis]|jgi:hypothetical protein|uniref:hypothetical protein n=1 Tax=Streptomyces adelaidensis TaxID=2796465 RepID=UPI0019075CB0|nr:hypothetical protein [Streptomyces adelaidensis]